MLIATYQYSSPDIFPYDISYLKIEKDIFLEQTYFHVSIENSLRPLERFFNNENVVVYVIALVFIAGAIILDNTLWRVLYSLLEGCKGNKVTPVKKFGTYS